MNKATTELIEFMKANNLYNLKTMGQHEDYMIEVEISKMDCPDCEEEEEEEEYNGEF